MLRMQSCAQIYTITAAAVKGFTSEKSLLNQIRRHPAACLKDFEGKAAERRRSRKAPIRGFAGGPNQTFSGKSKRAKGYLTCGVESETDGQQLGISGIGTKPKLVAPWAAELISWVVLPGFGDSQEALPLSSENRSIDLIVTP